MNEVRLRDLLLLLITSVGCLASNTGGAEVEASSAGSADRETCDGLMNRFFAFAEGKEAAATSIPKGTSVRHSNPPEDSLRTTRRLL
jgi:hypothetical protein